MTLAAKGASMLVHHWQHLLISAMLCCLACVVSTQAMAIEVNQPALVVIIDDVGNNWRQDKQLLQLPGPVTLSILPHTPSGPRVAALAAKHNKEVMLHAPMENHAGYNLGEGGLTSAMNEITFKHILRDSITNIPQAIGVNNHTGSSLTELDEPMRWTMEVIKNQGLFFIDSRTSARSVAFRQAQQHYIASRERDVFLDNDQSPEALDKQFQQAIRITQEKGAAILIGHPYQTTIDFLQQALPSLDELGIQLVSASALLYLVDKVNANEQTD